MKRARESLNVPTDSVPTELGRLIEEALRYLEGTNLHGANAVLEKACAEAASPREGAGSPRGYVGVDDGAAQGGHETGNESENRG